VLLHPKTWRQGMAFMPRGEPRSVPDPLADAWDEMVRQNNRLQAKNDPLAFGGWPREQAPAGSVEDQLRGAFQPHDEWQRLRSLQLEDSWRPQAVSMAGRQVSAAPKASEQTALAANSPGAKGVLDRAANVVRGAIGMEAERDRMLDVQRQAFEHRINGPSRETPRAADPVARWAEGRVGKGGYSMIDGAPDAHSRHDDILGPFGLRGWGDPKCNQFVWDALQAGGAPAGKINDPTIKGGRIPIAKDWGDPNSKIGGYRPVTGAPQPGDVISNGHHVGIYAPLPDGSPGTVSAATPRTPDGGLAGEVAHNNWGFRGDEGKITVWRKTPPPTR
jgi:hypothetical protein